MPSIDPRAVVAHHWPDTGPHSDDTITAAADAITYLVRYLNNTTQNPADVRRVATTHATLVYLASVAGGVSQLVRQLHSALAWQMSDKNPDPLYAWDATHSSGHINQVVTDAQTALTEAVRHATNLCLALTHAGVVLSPLGNREQEGSR